MREAVLLHGGIPALAEFARQKGKKEPEFYVDWIAALEKNGDVQEMLKAAREGLVAIPEGCTIRARIAEGLIRAGTRLKDTDAQLHGWHEAFHSDPSLRYLLNLLMLSENCGNFKKEIDEAIDRLDTLLKKPRKYRTSFFSEDDDPAETFTTKSLSAAAYLSGGRFEEALRLCDREGALGWSFTNNPKGLVLPFFLKLLTHGKKGSHSPNVEHLWSDAIENLVMGDFSSRNLSDQFQQIIGKVFDSIHLTPEEKEKHRKWCIREAGRRIDAIVSAKHRKSYHKAAGLLIATAEMLVVQSMISEAFDLIKKYREKYKQFSAFTRELRKIVERSRQFSLE